MVRIQAPLSLNIMDNDSSHSNSDLDTPDPPKTSKFRRTLYGFTMQGKFGLIMASQINPGLSKQEKGYYKEIDL